MSYKKISFLHLPTPMEYLPNISSDLGRDFYIKRDDLTSLGMGGNKLRKLEYLMKEALDRGATAVITVGGAQTNHGRLTAAVAAKLGLKCSICVVDPWPGELTGNMLLSRIMGAEIVLQAPDGRSESDQIAELISKTRDKYTAQGEIVYEIPVGGSTFIGALGYYDCALEIDDQKKAFDLKNVRLLCGVGSIGTYMGLYLGLKDCDSDIKLTGIAISPFAEMKEKRIMEYAEEANRKLDKSWKITREDFDIEVGYTRGAYNNVSAEVRDALCHMARREAIILDPCYTGKAYAGIRDMVKEGKIKPDETIIFLHTGGQPGIYTTHHRAAFEKDLMAGVHIL